MSLHELTLLLVRHGQATHNLPDKEKVLQWGEAGELDTELTDLGQRQAELVAKRLRDTVFQLAVSSHLKRARDTARAILEEQGEGQELEQWEVVRERNMGKLLEEDRELRAAQWTVEAAIKDRSLLTWRPPGGESVVELNCRVSKFLDLVMSRTTAMDVENPTVLVVTHGLFMREVYRCLYTVLCRLLP